MNPHLQPWNLSADDYPADGFTSDQLQFLLGYALLAPSNHNTQPWLFRINVSNVEVRADRSRALRRVDPFDRELAISCGAALFNLRTAAEYFGHACDVEAFPDPADPDLLARFYLRLSTQTSSEDVLLFHAICQRRTNRAPFRPDLVPEAVLDELAGAAQREGAWLQLLQADASKAAVAELVAAGDRTQWADPDYRKELAAWLRPNPAQHVDGIAAHDVGVRNWMAFAGPALIRTFDRGNRQAAQDAAVAVHSPVLAVLGTAQDDPSAWLNAGQALESVLLHAQTEGLAASFLNQPIEVAELRSQLTEVIGRAGYPQVLLRLGYGPPVGPTPRRDLRAMTLRQPAVRH